MVKIWANESEASNLLKLKYKFNNKLLCCLLDSRMTNSFITPQTLEWLEVKIELMVNPITVHLA
jgi:hypothetical protein